MNKWLIWQPTPVFLPGESHGQMSLVGYSPRGRKESDTTERLTLSHFNSHLLSLPGLAAKKCCFSLPQPFLSTHETWCLFTHPPVNSPRHLPPDGNQLNHTVFSLYILVITSLAVVSLAIIFSHSECCLFTLLIVSFVVQKF